MNLTRARVYYIKPIAHYKSKKIELLNNQKKNYCDKEFPFYVMDARVILSPDARARQVYPPAGAFTTAIAPAASQARLKRSLSLSVSRTSN